MVIEGGNRVAGRIVFSTKHHIAHTLFQLSDISRPGVIQSKMIPNPSFHFGSNWFAFRSRYP
jgi:hypothetical protein